MLLLNWIDTLGLLPQDQDSNVLSLFGEQARRTIVLETVAQLAGPGRPALVAGLGTYAQVRFVLELAGEAFGLGMEDLAAMVRLAEVYGEWLLEAGRRPPGVGAGDADEFCQTLVKHLSVVFGLRRAEGKSSVAQLQHSKHVEACRAVLKTYAACARAGDLSAGSWKVLLVVLLGVADSLLRLPLLPPCALADDLTEDLLAVLLEAWLRSGSMSSALWRALRTYYPRWCHRLAAVNQWTAVSLALTQRVSKHLYGHGTPAVAYTVHREPVSLELAPQFELFAWRQHLGLVGSPGDLPPANCLRAILGTEAVLQVFYAVGHPPGQAEYSGPVDRQLPDGNTLLALFGRWLFDAATLPGSEHAECVAHASGLLCRLFTRPQFRAPFSTGYMSQFYQALAAALEHPSLLVTVFVCINCEELFTARLEGVRVLALPFLHALRRLVPKPQAALQLNIQMVDLRRACYKLLCTLLSFGNHFAGAGVVAQPPEPSLGNTYSEALAAVLPAAGEHAFLFLCYDTLVSCLLVEADPANRRYLVNSLCTAVVDSAPAHPALADLLVQVLADLLLRADNTADPETAMVTLEALKHLGQLPAVLGVQVDARVAAAAIQALCEAIAPLVRAAPPSGSKHLRLLEMAVDVLLGWACYAPGQLSSQPDSVARLMATIELLFSLGPSKTDLGQLALTRLLVRFGAEGLNPLLPGLASARVTEFDYAPAPEDCAALQYFVLNESVVGCFVETPDEQLVLVLRTATGRYAWKAALHHAPDAPAEPAAAADRLADGLHGLALSPDAPPPPGPAKQPPGPEHGALFNDDAFSRQLENDPRRLQNVALIDRLCQEQARALDSCRLAESPAYAAGTYAPRPSDPLRGKLTRLLLAHFGFLAPESSWFLQPLPVTADLFTEIQSLDELPERETLSVSVFFVRSGMQGLAEILAEQRVSLDFLHFVQALGWPVENGPASFLDLGPEAGKTVPYYADGDVELVYHVPSLLPLDRDLANLGRLTEQLGSLLGANPVALVWLEDPSELLTLPSKFGLPATLVYICVIPMTGCGSDGLYRIRIMVTAPPPSAHAGDGSAKVSSFTFGPLLDGMVLRREMLGTLVRSTAISASLYCLYHLGGAGGTPESEPSTPTAARAQMILDLARKYEALDHESGGNVFDHFYRTILFPGTDDGGHAPGNPTSSLGGSADALKGRSVSSASAAADCFTTVLAAEDHRASLESVASSAHGRTQTPPEH